jgi:hypothetical protein
MTISLQVQGAGCEPLISYCKHPATRMGALPFVNVMIIHIQEEIDHPDQILRGIQVLFDLTKMKKGDLFPII